MLANRTYEEKARETRESSENAVPAEVGCTPAWNGVSYCRVVVIKDPANYTSAAFRNCPVKLSFTCATSSGVPSATM